MPRRAPPARRCRSGRADRPRERRRRGPLRRISARWAKNRLAAVSRLFAASAICAVGLCAIAVAGCSGGGDDSTASTSTAALSPCDINGKQQDLGASYVTSLEVAHVGCDQAQKVILAYHHCRQANGRAGGTCKSAVA